jgi:hypothetical protein
MPNFTFEQNGISYSIEITLHNEEILILAIKNLKINKSYLLQINDSYMGGSLCDVGSFSNDMAVNYDRKYCTCRSYYTFFIDKVSSGNFTLREYEELDMAIINIKPLELILDNPITRNKGRHMMKNKFDLLLQEYNKKNTV